MHDKPSIKDIVKLQVFEMRRNFPNSGMDEIKKALNVGYKVAPSHPIYSMIAAMEFHERQTFPGNPVKHAVSPLYNQPAQSRRRLFQEMLLDMREGDLPDNFYSEVMLNGDDIHLLLLVIFMARERGSEAETTKDDIVTIKTSSRELMRGLGWSVGGKQQGELFESLKKLAHNRFLCRDAKGRRRHATGFLYAVGTEDALIIEIAKPVIEIVNNYFYSISLLFMKTLEMKKPEPPLVNPVELFLTKRQRRMCKKLYVLSKVQKIPKTETWEYFLHITGEEYDFGDKRRRNDAKKDIFAAMSFLQRLGQVEVERDTKGKSVTFQKGLKLSDAEKGNRQETVNVE